jgi:adenine-specific DNA-methyltransferase
MHPFDDIVHPSDPEKFIHIPSSVSHSTAKASLQGLNTSLTDLGIRVSTGRVVDFRAKDALRQNPVEGSVPLLYPSHFSEGQIAWPKPDSRKPNAIIDNHMTRSSLVPAGIYVLTKRFTSKEERKRIVACLFNPESVQHPWIGIENHLNYFHANGKGLPENLAKGLFAFLNSTVLDEYFRRFSGHTQVNATDLRTLAYPDAATLERIGRHLKTPYQSQQNIDQLIDRYLIGSRNEGQRHV